MTPNTPTPNTPTPRTDAEECEVRGGANILSWFVNPDFARTLERELSEAKEKSAEKSENYRQQSEWCERLVAERAQLRADLAAARQEAFSLIKDLVALGFNDDDDNELGYDPRSFNEITLWNVKQLIASRDQWKAVAEELATAKGILAHQAAQEKFNQLIKNEN